MLEVLRILRKRTESEEYGKSVEIQKFSFSWILGIMIMFIHKRCINSELRKKYTYCLLFSNI